MATQSGPKTSLSFSPEGICIVFPLCARALSLSLYLRSMKKRKHLGSLPLSLYISIRSACSTPVWTWYHVVLTLFYTYTSAISYYTRALTEDVPAVDLSVVLLQIMVTFSKL